MSLIRKHVAVLQAWACLDLVDSRCTSYHCIASDIIYLVKEAGS